MKIENRLNKIIFGSFLSIALISVAACQDKPYEALQDGMIVHLKKTSETASRTLRLTVVSERIIHVSASPEKSFSKEKSLMIEEKDHPTPKFTVEKKKNEVVLHTSSINAIVRLSTGEVTFTDSLGKAILTEKKGGGKSFVPVHIQGKDYYSIRQQFETQDDEALYGLGENQTSILNLKGKDADLFQYNTVAIVPFIVSTKNYGILWDNNSRTKFGDIRDFNGLSGLKLYDISGKAGSLTAIYSMKADTQKVFVTRPEKEISYQFLHDLKKFPAGFKLGDGLVKWAGSIESDTSGLHKFIFTSAGYAKLWLDGKLLIDRWRQCWNPCSIRFEFLMEKGKKYPLKIEWIPDGGESYIALKHLTPLDTIAQNRISFYSGVADQIDYYFIYGQNIDEVISGYRSLTGKAPIMPKWAMGFWQSRERYKTQDEILNTVREFRERQIPIDNIVLDWFYWKEDKWGDHEFDPTRFPDPDAMIKTLHDSLNAHFMISVWPKFYTGTKNYEEMNRKGWLYKKNVEDKKKDWVGYVSTFYDAFNSDARKYFWDQMNTKLFSKGVDAWWLDATEPDILSNESIDERKALMNPTALGPSDKYFNAFPIMNARGVYEGQREIKPDQRVFILTRSAFAGSQRYAASTWSGDIAARWHDMKAQIPAGLNFCISGIPYWTMDIGGFAVENRYIDAKGETLEEWREQMTRWFQFGTFCPIFRVHGQYPYREIFNVAPENHPAYQAMLSSDKLRYRLMPYIYSLAGKTFHENYTIMRALVMDFENDKAVFNIDDQFMFGPQLLINPVCEYKARSRKVYLPVGSGWYDLFTGKYYPGGQTIIAEAPISSIPVFVKEGSILPFGPEIQYTSQKPADPVTLFVYPGKDGSFTLYEDENTNYNYEKGAFSQIPISYTESDLTLTIRNRTGNFKGMLEKRTFNLILVKKNKPQKLNFDAIPDKVITYEGNEIRIKL